ncbi:MAG: PDZ domain-containing protein, partial [Nitrospira sp.]|nr:PDZ domain-containing protein [Nitrospira sp.]
GRIGVHWQLEEERGDRFYLVRELRSGLPAEKAGLRVGDRVIGCNGLPLADVKTERDAKRICQVESGRRLQLDVMREEQFLDVQVIAEKRPGL